MAANINGAPDFMKGDVVYCLSGELFYEAKVLETAYEETNGCWTYLVHFRGWKRSWDKWVPQSQLVKVSDESTNKAASMERLNKGDSKCSRLQKGTKARTRGKADVNSEAKEEPNGIPVELPSSEPEPSGDPKMPETQLDDAQLNALFPPTLMAVLVHDHDQIILNGLVLKIPLVQCVDVILDEFRDWVRHPDFGEGGDVDQMQKTLKLTSEFAHEFERRILNELLYPGAEQLQRAKIIRELRGQGTKLDSDIGSELSKVYGLAHLLRFCSYLQCYVEEDSHLRDKLLGLHNFLPKFYDFLEVMEEEFMDKKEDYTIFT